MDLSDSPEEARFRADARRWLEKTLPTLPWPEPADLSEKVPFWKQWQRALFDGGYAGLSWPAQYGGGGVGPNIRAIFAEELDRAGAPERLNTIGEDFAGPTIIDFGTDAQKERYLRPILQGQEIWCQLFSEPEAGSDLASLRTRATRVEGGWRIDGQKIWTSRAHVAAHAILLARTGSEAEPRHRGISYFLLPLDTEGVTIRPLAHMLGEAEFNEVFLDNVFIPDSGVVGEINGGWPIAMATLGYERVAIATGRVNTQRAVRDIIADVRDATDRDGAPLGADARVRDTVADLWARALTHYLIGQRVVTSAAEGGAPGAVTSIGKLYFCPLVEDLADFRLSMMPLGGQLALDDQGPDSHAPDNGTDVAHSRWLRLAYQSRGTAIAGGSTFIQRNIIAERMLAMPRSRS